MFSRLNQLWSPLVLPMLVIALSSCTSYPPLSAPTQVDLEKYQGKWYEIARLDHFFQRGCVWSTAEYTLEGSQMKVVNRCRAADGTERAVVGRALPIPDKPAQFAVSFNFWSSLFTGSAGNYWIIALDPDYQWAIVGHPNRAYLWWLARTPEISPSLRQQMLTISEQNQFDTGLLEFTPPNQEPNTSTSNQH